MDILFVPTIGTKIHLAEDWTFTLFRKRRNSGFWEAYTGEEVKKDFLIRDGEMTDLARIEPIEAFLLGE